MPLVLKKALFVPGYQTNLVSVSNIVDNGHKSFHRKGQCFFVLKAEIQSLKREKKNFSFHKKPSTWKSCCKHSCEPNQLELWHKRLGVLNYEDFKSSVPIKLEENAKCEFCCLAKISETHVLKQTEYKESKLL